jgi:hypothetical protein
MTLEEKILDILKKDKKDVRIPEPDNKTDSEIWLYTHKDKDNSFQIFFANLTDGNMAHIRRDEDSENYDKVFEASNKEFYDKIIEVYEENMAFFNKYKSIIKNDRNVRIYLEDPYFYYNKRSKTLYAIPTIKVKTIAASFSFYLYPSQLKKINIAVDKIYEDFYQHLFQCFLQKPLNKYSEEELTLFHMIKI